MIGQVIGFLGSSAGAAVVGLLLEYLGNRQKMKEQERQAAHERDLAYHKQLENHAVNLDRAATGEAHDRSWRFKIGSFEIERKRKAISYPPRVWVVSFSLLLLVCTFCAILLLWAGFPAVPIDTLDPSAEPTEIGIPWLFMAKFNQNDIFTLSLGGIVYSMLVSVNFMITTAIVGGVRRHLR